MRRVAVTMPLLLLGLACVESRNRPTVPVFGDLAVLSDPAGAVIFLDGRRLEGVTPDTLAELAAGRHALELQLESGRDEFFLWRDSVDVPEEGLGTVDAPLEGGCGRDCPFQIDAGRIVCRLNTLGDTCAGAFFSDQVALQWPGAEGDYAAGGRLLAAAILGTDAGPRAGDTMATLVFRQSWTGRRPVRIQTSGSCQVVRRRYWATSLLRPAPLLGLEVQETLVAVDSATVRDLLFVHYRVENVSDDPRYRRIYPEIPAGGYTFESLYLGFGFDIDVGVASDDLGSFDPDLRLGFVYDADFLDAGLGDRADRPALVGLVTIEPPDGATERTLTLWRSGDDWDDGLRTDFAWRVLAGRLRGGDPIEDHPAPELGFLSDVPDDYRLTEAHGPLTLQPGAAVEFTVGLLLAEPAAGTFTPGQVVAPGDPLDPDRAVLQVAESLRELARVAPELWERYRP